MTSEPDTDSTYDEDSPGEAGDSCRVWQIWLPAAGQAAGLARQATREALALWRAALLEETAVLLVSELVTNSVRHARSTAPLLVLRLETSGTWLRIEVHDADSRRPQPRTPAGLDESGYGFVLVNALAGRWGVLQTATGKVVWAELDARQGGEAS